MLVFYENGARLTKNAPDSQLLRVGGDCEVTFSEAKTFLQTRPRKKKSGSG